MKDCLWDNYPKPNSYAHNEKGRLNCIGFEFLRFC